MKSQADFLALNPRYGETEYLCYLQGFYEAMMTSNTTLEGLARQVLAGLELSE